MFKALQNGYEFPDTVSYELWDYTRNHKDEDKALTGYVGFGSSFGGRFFQGYARDGGHGRNYAKETKNALMRDAEKLKQIEFMCNDYKDVVLPDGCVVYCDPPYNSTKTYAYMGKFDTDEFWEYMREISAAHLVFITEQNAPDDFISIWEKPLTRTLNRDSSEYFQSMEHIFIHKCYQ